ncbi:MAG TPA: sigma-70 family RNA polymerase sigma factor [Gemmatimonadaceae bacterium]|nr:sigma-70 family RNA polymerase sigma factor [Gemmatimonadaceae bacterium]
MPTDRELQFLTLVRQNDARLHRICRVYAGGNDEQRDLLQEILLQLWRSLPSFAGASSPDTWLYRVALNTALTHARRDPARRETALEDEIAVDDAPADVTDAGLDVRARQEQLHAAIARLDPVNKMLMAMYLDERSYREIADVIGITENHVGVKLHRIKQALARQLTRETV